MRGGESTVSSSHCTRWVSPRVRERPVRNRTWCMWESVQEEEEENMRLQLLLIRGMPPWWLSSQAVRERTTSSKHMLACECVLDVAWAINKATVVNFPCCFHSLCWELWVILTTYPEEPLSLLDGSTSHYSHHPMHPQLVLFKTICMKNTRRQKQKGLFAQAVARAFITKALMCASLYVFVFWTTAKFDQHKVKLKGSANSYITGQRALVV